MSLFLLHRIESHKNVNVKESWSINLKKSFSQNFNAWYASISVYVPFLVHFSSNLIRWTVYVWDYNGNRDKSNLKTIILFLDSTFWFDLDISNEIFLICQPNRNQRNRLTTHPWNEWMKECMFYHSACFNMIANKLLCRYVYHFSLNAIFLSKFVPASLINR